MFRRKHFLIRPSFVQSHPEGCVRNAKSTSPVAKAIGFSFVSQHSRLASVLTLFQFRSPSTVSWLVVAIAVNAINSGIWRRFWSHVIKEIYKGNEPSVTHLNSLFDVKMCVWVVRCVAAALHFLPRCVLGRIAHASSSCAMAAARNCTFLSKVRPGNDSCVTALALTQPVSQFVSNFVKMDHSQLAVNIPRLVFDAGRQLDRINRRHDLTPDKLDCDRAESVHNDCFGSFYFIRM